MIDTKLGPIPVIARGNGLLVLWWFDVETKDVLKPARIAIIQQTLVFDLANIFHFITSIFNALVSRIRITITRKLMEF